MSTCPLNDSKIMNRHDLDNCSIYSPTYWSSFKFCYLCKKLHYKIPYFKYSSYGLLKFTISNQFHEAKKLTFKHNATRMTAWKMQNRYHENQFSPNNRTMHSLCCALVATKIYNTVSQQTTLTQTHIIHAGENTPYCAL